MTPSKRLRADLALGFCALIWGSTFLIVKNALADVSVFTYIAVRFSFAALLSAEALTSSPKIGTSAVR